MVPSAGPLQADRARKRNGHFRQTERDLAAEVAKLKKAQLHFRNDIVSGPCGSEVLLDDIRESSAAP
jgi:hypothetical protein